jgi:glutathione-specific gamma-glutamylcyclotransferase
MTSTSSTSYTLAYFGYGSLVNELTWLQSERRHLERYPVEVQNWTREWRHCVDTPNGPVCALTAVERAGGRIQGILIRCDAADLVQIDAREVGYDRVELPRRDLLSSISNLPEKLYTYKSKSSYYRLGGMDYPIWFSYVEAVLHGYLSVFKTEGVDAFIKSTSGWTVPVIDDRHNPQYNRSVKNLISAEDKIYLEQKVRQIIGIQIIGVEGWERARSSSAANRSAENGNT